MKVEHFIRILEKEIVGNSPGFISNMYHLSIPEKTFCEWLEIFIAWMEWNMNDCLEFYGDQYES